MKLVRNGTAWLIAAALWLSTLSWWFDPGPPEARREALLRAQLADLAEREAPHRMREQNPEWDLMQRMYRVLAFGNRALRDDDDEARAAVVRIVDDTLARERAHGPHHFLLGYSRAGSFVGPTGRSIFVEGEIAMMLAVRELVAPSDAGHLVLARRVDAVVEQLEAAPICAESYPDECWSFCNTVALAALQIADVTLGTDHRPLAKRWLEGARAHLIDPRTGLLGSSFTYDGRPMDGPEGSSLWMTAHNLRLVEPAFAEEQFRLARSKLAVHVLGFGYAKEWPDHGGMGDVDSGPVIPLLGASPGSSGTAILGAASFGDEEWLDALLRSLSLVTAPRWKEGRLSYAAAGPMGDAVIFYAHEQGTLWRHVNERSRAHAAR